MRPLYYIIFSFIFATQALAFKYEHRDNGQQSIHLITVNPEENPITLARALNIGLGRETVESIAKRKGAVAATNAGFFRIGGNEDGRPVDILKIEDEWFNLPRKPRGTIGWNDHRVIMDRLLATATLTISNKELPLARINQAPAEEELTIFFPSYNKTTLTSANHVEYIFKRNKLSQIRESGDSPIPANGFVISRKKNFIDAETLFLLKPKVNGRPKVHFKPLDNHTSPKEWETMENIVGGAPLMIADGEIIADFDREDIRAAFLAGTEARTAVGILPSGEWLIVVVDQNLDHNIHNQSVKNVYRGLKNMGLGDEKAQRMTLSEVAEAFTTNESEFRVGMSIPQLAKFMQKEGCTWALNLDGGGSSTLFYEGKIVNTPMGDEDEGEGERMIRRVSDALLIMPKAS